MANDDLTDLDREYLEVMAQIEQAENLGVRAIASVILDRVYELQVLAEDGDEKAAECIERLINVPDADRAPWSRRAAYMLHELGRYERRGDTDE